MRYVVVEKWSLQDSLLHRRDPRAKLLALLLFLSVVATTQSFSIPGPLYLALLLVAASAARLPVLGALTRAAVVLPFALVFALVVSLAGHADRVFPLVGKAYVSALAALLLVATTPMPKLLHGLGRLRVPRFLIMVGQFLYRYLFVIVEEATRMRTAALSRGGFRPGTSLQHRFGASAALLGSLFARSYARAERIHGAMLARGFDGRFPVMGGLRFGWGDAVFLLLAIVPPFAVRIFTENRA